MELTHLKLLLIVLPVSSGHVIKRESNHAINKREVDVIEEVSKLRDEVVDGWASMFGKMRDSVVGSEGNGLKLKLKDETEKLANGTDLTDMSGVMSSLTGNLGGRMRDVADTFQDANAATMRAASRLRNITADDILFTVKKTLKSFVDDIQPEVDETLTSMKSRVDDLLGKFKF